ncbi:hypothetical protein [Bdellovibrio sp. HCB2-146]|uniref:hypothetical protein n=1 Tax=Bdellovibrio sp. HCB2-146 TaxID=3394362 RepID=UPI0039BC6E78
MIVLFLTALLFILPFIPTLLEILHPSDNKATPISKYQLKDVRNTQQDFFSILSLLLQNEKWLTLDSSELVAMKDSHLRGIYALQDLRILPGSHPVTIAGEKTLICDSGSQIYEAHAREKIIVQDKAEILWWATAPKIELRTGIHQRGKLEASEHLQVLGNCMFSSLKSPNIEIGNFTRSASPQKIQPTTQRQIFFKEWRNQDKTLIGDYIIENHAHLTANTTLRGSLKVDGNLTIEQGCHIEGHVFVGGSLISEGDTKISGVVIVEKNLNLGPQHEIGHIEAICTVSADKITIQGPQLIHGTLRCWEEAKIQLG